MDETINGKNQKNSLTSGFLDLIWVDTHNVFAPKPNFFGTQGQHMERVRFSFAPEPLRSCLLYIPLT